MSGYLAIFLIAFGFTLVATPVVIWLAFKTGFLDLPTGDPLKIHKRPVPMLGGMGITLAVLATLWTIAAMAQSDFLNQKLMAIAGAVTILFLVGLYDDYKGLSPYKRLLGQGCAAIIVISQGDLSVSLFSSEVANYLVTVLYLLLLINAVNLLDGMDGLATGVTMVAATGFLFGFAIIGNVVGILFSLVLLGVTAGFLPFNFAPAKIFLGDNGSTVLGFLLGILTILFTASPSSMAQVAAPILILIVPLLDLTLTVFRRLQLRSSLFTGDREHLYDRFLRSGLTQRQTAMLLYGFGIAGLLTATYVLDSSFMREKMKTNLLHNSAVEIPLSRPDITNKEISAVVAVLQSPHLSLGPKLIEFEERFAEYLGVKFAVAVNSGTSGLHLALKSLGIGERDAVITTPFSFVASANSILFEKATPIFVDIDEQTLNIDPDKISEYFKEYCRRNPSGEMIDSQTGKRVRAILPVHVFGLPCEMDRIMDLAYRYDLAVVEDACEAIGAEFDGKKVGSFGDAGVFAFYPNKQITTGEGGIITTNNESVSRLCRSLRNQGRGESGAWLAHERLGYNYRLSELNCALGIAQLSRIEEILEKRARVAALYNDRLHNLVLTPQTCARMKRSWFAYVPTLPSLFSKNDRDEILVELRNRGVCCNNYFPPIHLQGPYIEMFQYRPGQFEITESIAERTVALPFHNNLTLYEIDYVVDSLREILDERIETLTWRGEAVDPIGPHHAAEQLAMRNSEGMPFVFGATRAGDIKR
jgi:perosamine synthetase